MGIPWVGTGINCYAISVKYMDFKRALVLVWVTTQNNKLRYGPFTSTLVTPIIHNWNFRRSHACHAQDEFEGL